MEPKSSEQKSPKEPLATAVMAYLLDGKNEALFEDCKNVNAQVKKYWNLQMNGEKQKSDKAIDHDMRDLKKRARDLIQRDQHGTPLPISGKKSTKRPATHSEPPLTQEQHRDFIEYNYDDPRDEDYESEGPKSKKLKRTTANYNSNTETDEDDDKSMPQSSAQGSVKAQVKIEESDDDEF